MINILGMASWLKKPGVCIMDQHTQEIERDSGGESKELSLRMTIHLDENMALNLLLFILLHIAVVYVL